MNAGRYSGISVSSFRRACPTVFGHFLAIAVVASIIAQSGQAAAQTTVPPAVARAETSPIPPPPIEYLLGGGDLVRITVYQNPDLSLEARVSEAGTINFPLLGTLNAGGRSASQLETLIADALKTGNFVKQPQVTALVLQVRGNQVNVLGQVNRPGRFPLEVGGMRLSDVLALAGGLSTSGAEVVTLTRPLGKGQNFRTEIDVERVFTATSDPIDDFRVFNGDVLYVGRAPTFYIYGEVQRPGAARLERNMTVMQGLATGGGLTQRGTEKGVKIYRREADGTTSIIAPRMTDLLRGGDVIYVRESLF